MLKKVCFCIVGKSGTGKSYIAKKLTEDYEFVQVDSYTTRPPRKGETSGHIFISEEVANKWLKDDIVAYGIYGGYQYFATREQIDNSDVYVVDKQGLEGLADTYVDNDNQRLIMVIYIKTKFITRMVRLIKSEGLIRGAKRALRDIGKFRGLNKFESLTLYNDTLEDAERICKIINEMKLGIQYS